MRPAFVGGLNGSSWSHFQMILPYALVGILLCFLLPSKMNILMLGDETANSLGLRTEWFRFFLIAVSSLLSGAAIAVAGLISFVRAGRAAHCASARRVGLQVPVPGVGVSRLHACRRVRYHRAHHHAAG